MVTASPVYIRCHLLSTFLIGLAAAETYMRGVVYGNMGHTIGRRSPRKRHAFLSSIPQQQKARLKAFLRRFATAWRRRNINFPTASPRSLALSTPNSSDAHFGLPRRTGLLSRLPTVAL